MLNEVLNEINKVQLKSLQLNLVKYTFFIIIKNYIITSYY